MGTFEYYAGLAKEQELVRKFDVATRHWEECTKLADLDPGMWYDFALYALRASDNTKTEEALKEALSLDGKNWEV